MMLYRVTVGYQAQLGQFQFTEDYKIAIVDIIPVDNKGEFYSLPSSHIRMPLVERLEKFISEQINRSNVKLIGYMTIIYTDQKPFYYKWQIN